MSSNAPAKASSCATARASDRALNLLYCQDPDACCHAEVHRLFQGKFLMRPGHFPPGAPGSLAGCTALLCHETVILAEAGSRPVSPYLLPATLCSWVQTTATNKSSSASQQWLDSAGSKMRLPRHSAWHDTCAFTTFGFASRLG